MIAGRWVALFLVNIKRGAVEFMSEPESLILQLLRQMRAELGEVRAEVKEFATKSDVGGLRAELRAKMSSPRADVASDILTAQKELSEQIVGLRRAVIDCHARAAFCRAALPL